MSELITHLAASPLVKRVFVPRTAELERTGPHINIEFRKLEELGAILEKAEAGKITLTRQQREELEEVVEDCRRPQGSNISPYKFGQALRDEFKVSKYGLNSISLKEMAKGGVVWDIRPPAKSPRDWTLGFNQTVEENMRRAIGDRQNVTDEDEKKFRREAFISASGKTNLKEAGAISRKVLQDIREGVTNIEKANEYLKAHHNGELTTKKY